MSPVRKYGSVVAVIPARYGATRFPGKLLADLHGRPVLEWVHRRARRIPGLDRILIATDDERIERAAAGFGAEVVRTRADHASGTDRVGEVLDRLDPIPGFVLNLQGDEPLLPVAAAGALITAMCEAEPDSVWTLIEPLPDHEEWRRPSVVKVAVARDGRALYFSRAAIPFFREASGAEGPIGVGFGTEAATGPGSGRGLEPGPAGLGPGPWRHVGIYGYPVPLLRRIRNLPISPLERIEGLEQLRWMEAGIQVRVGAAPGGSPGIDTPEDLERLRRRYPTAADLEADVDGEG